MFVGVGDLVFDNCLYVGPELARQQQIPFRIAPRLLDDAVINLANPSLAFQQLL